MEIDDFLLIVKKYHCLGVMQIHKIMVLIFITCAMINHLFFTFWSVSVMHFFFNDSSTFKVNNFQHD